ncbi:hypothetical protein ST37_10100 [Vibrio sp. qd031]|uniref:hypothetical protein n=1 Tax=Vibrio sp. qd031 TaxID=1603038 RepID=UPI000A0F894E|nr:hypothetical protein [Vibrio sp. qd031]ORT50238.1 hypothetical protein ST37_10100 [Vibrio sp. qd031]
MRLKQRAKNVVLAWMLVLPIKSYAIEINTLFSIANDNGVATFTLGNPQRHRLFINIGMSEVQIESGELIKIPYTRDNIDDWKIEVRPGRAIINPNFEKDFQVLMRCGGECDRRYDQVFQVMFVPSPYFPELEGEQDAKVQMSFGLAPYVLLPGEEVPLDYDIRYEEGALRIENHSANYFKLRVDVCGEAAIDYTCSATYQILGGRHVTLSLSDIFIESKLRLQLRTHNNQYEVNEWIFHGGHLWSGNTY